MTQMDAARFRAQELDRPRHADRKRLTRYGYKVFSQSDEDGIIAEIFNRIGVTARTFVEFGVEVGLECNSLWLLVQGWRGLWIDGNAAHCARIQDTHAHLIADGSLTVSNAFITAENINALIGQRFKDEEIDLLSIDLDYNDHWVWQAIDVVNPRVVVIEYNAAWVPPVAITVPYAADRIWDGTNYYGVSLSALAKLGERKGYALVGCCLAGVNAFFVRKDLLENRFLNPGSAEDHYEPPRYFLAGLPAGHPSAIGPLVQID